MAAWDYAKAQDDIRLTSPATSQAMGNYIVDKNVTAGK